MFIVDPNNNNNNSKQAASPGRSKQEVSGIHY
jgi:hypothetical protein